MRFEAEFGIQGTRKGKSSSKSQISHECLLELYNSFEPLADFAGDVAIGHQDVEIPAQSFERDLPAKPKSARYEEEDFDAILAEFAVLDGKFVAGGGRGSGRKKGSLGKKFKEEIKEDIKEEVKTKVEQVVKEEIVSSQEEEPFEGAMVKDVEVSVVSDAIVVCSPPAKKRRLADGQEDSLVLFSPIDKISDSGRKRQMSMVSFFGSPEEKAALKRGRSEEEVIVDDIRKGINRSEQFRIAESKLAERCLQDRLVYVKKTGPEINMACTAQTREVDLIKIP